MLEPYDVEVYTVDFNMIEPYILEPYFAKTKQKQIRIAEWLIHNLYGKAYFVYNII